MNDRTFEVAVRTLARRVGLLTAYRDGMNVKREVPLTTLQAAMESMGVPVATDHDVRQALAELVSREWGRVVNPVIVRPQLPRRGSLTFSLPVGEVAEKDLLVEGTMRDEDGDIRPFRYHGQACRQHDFRIFHGQRFCRVTVPFPSCEAHGYYRLGVRVVVNGRSFDGDALVIVPPLRCYAPGSSHLSWGVTVQLAALRSSRNWGCGDFGDLEQVMHWAGHHGADTVGVNPLHVGVPGVISPYSPSSRLFINPIYLDVRAVPEFYLSAKMRRRLERSPFRRVLVSLRERDTVDYEAVQAMKRKVFDLLYREFCLRHLKHDTPRAREFSRFIAAGGRNLLRFAIFQALSEQFHSSSWRHRWPPGYRHPDFPDVVRFMNTHSRQIQFHQYLQWLCDQQLRALNDVARRSGLGLGAYHDLPVGIHPDGADAWIFQHQLAQGMSIGAPPDAFNVHGQNWGLIPINPLQLRAQGHELFIETIRRNMRYGRVLRIDHAMGLFRLFWIPDRAPSSAGVYVRYPVEELLAIMALESMRAQVMVVGEDLGTVTPRIRTRLAQSGMLSYRLLLFERTATGGFRRPSSFPPQALVAVTTHDLPTIRGFWSGRDIDIKEQLGVYANPSLAQEAREQRARDRVALFMALRREGLLPWDCSLDTIPSTLTDELCEAIYRYLARTDSRLLMMTMEDLIGEVEAPNVPGISETVYPSWRRKLSRSLEEWTQDPAVCRLTAAVDGDRRASSVIDHQGER